jgi:hypothetical protein
MPGGLLIGRAEAELGRGEEAGWRQEATARMRRGGRVETAASIRAAPLRCGMPRSELERVFEALEASGARYLVAGGVAVVLHGHPRFTADLDLALALDRENLSRALRALASLGYRPRAPVPLNAFADPEQRAEWVRTKGLTVFSLWSSELTMTEIDLFVADPIPFEEAWPRRLRADLAGLT